MIKHSKYCLSVYYAFFVENSDNAGQQQQGAVQPQTTPASPAVTKPDPPDVLPKAKCLEALAALRHYKWFQV